MSHQVRRVVTGHDDQGRSIVVSDGQATGYPLGRPGLTLFDVWRTTEVPATITATEPDPTAGGLDFEITPRGLRFRILETPGGESPDAPWMHRTNSVDYGYVIEGEMCMLLDDGVEVVLRQGDVVIQRGTNHAWANRSGKRCLMIFIMVGAEFAPELADLELYSPEAMHSTITASAE